ncbi:M20 aminoacylase family protein [Chelativorans sp. YIM 93263]|uniref:M20 aminoacylase family protein n=1 Tax=Chelativorans sp. YIM 93263 TaxID=2906648 RepID=UPI0023794FA9|nr:M20 aminoacylase family protein [Chelativorans sp. YIM 93263]
MNTIRDYFQSIEADLKEWRQELHQNPELAFEEHWTSDFVAEKLKSFGYEPVRGLGGTGVVATISNGEGPSVGLRADMDALPILEQTNLPFASKNSGKMHACGHDGHMTMLLAAARYFAESRDFQGTLHFIFQPAEEGEAGADAMIKDGLFEQFPVQEVYGLHNWPGLEEGSFAGRVGPQMAAFDVFEIKITGQGAHAAMPHLGKDLLLAAANIQSQLQSIIARSVDPLDTGVVSVTQIHGGDAWNVLPSEVIMRGCTRHFTSKVQDLIEQQMSEICQGVARSFGISVDLDYMRRYPSTVNTERETEIALSAAKAVAGEDKVSDTLPPSMASEDFAFMLQKKPGCYLWVGAGSTEGGCMLHSPTYTFNDKILAPGAAWWVNVAKTALKRGTSA